MINVPEQTAAGSGVLSQMKTDVLTLVDITADFSNREILATKDMLFDAFAQKAPKAEAPRVADLQAEIDRSVDDALKLREKESTVPVKVPVNALGRESGAVMPPSTRDQRKILTRREMLTSLLSGHIGDALRAAEAEEKREEGRERVIEPEYFDQVLAAGLEGEFGLASLTAWDGTELVGCLRILTDGCFFGTIPEVLVLPRYQRQGIGSALLRAVLNRYADVRQTELVTDDTPETTAFYRSMGFRELTELGCRGFMKI